MDTPSSGVAAAPSEGSTPASLSAGTLPNQDGARDIVGSLGNPAPLEMGRLDNDGDDASDISMSSETDDSDDDMEGGSLQIITPQIVPEPFLPVSSSADQSKKRKLSSDVPNLANERLAELDTIKNSKRIKLDLTPDLVLHNYRTADGHLPVDRSLLPAEVWHHVFSFTPPKALGRLLHVNKRFRAYLEYSDSANTSLLASLSRSSAPLRRPEAIWQAARRLFRPGMPTPLDGSTELDMWKLACNTACQFCGRNEQQLSQNSIDQWHSGPGENGIRPVWAFSARTCGSCLKAKTIKEIDLLLSSSVPSPLMAALPFVFLTSEFHIISPNALQNGQPPADVQIGKYFYKPHVEDIKMEFFRVKAMGSGTAEEWLKGLDKRGRERKSDAARWERWESTGGVQRMQVSEPAELKEVIVKTTVTDVAAPLQQLSIPLPALPPTGLSRIPVVMNDFSQPGQMPYHPIQTIQVPYVTNTPPRFDSPIQNGFNPYQQRSFQLGRQERTKEEVAELKAARKREIERRSMLLDPPLAPGVLAHMGSFQAAIQIIKPFDDDAWELLKPRLLSQRSEAEQRENDRIALCVMQERLDERQNQLTQAKDGKDGVDRDWEDAQTPLRSRIGAYADEVIRDGWNWGEKVTKDNSPTFAAEVLLYVRKRFYAEIAKDDAAARAAGQQPKIDPPNGPFTQKLILENMKWVFDMRIKPHTEQYRKELFLCNGCENNFKFYGFEGVIQHYAAKHTSALSVGSIVVHWRAEWPEYPPFNPEPGNPNGSNGPYIAPAPGTPFANGPPNLPLAFGRGGFSAVSAPLATAAQVTHPTAYQESSIDYYSHPQQGDKYLANQVSPFVPPTTFAGPIQSFPTSQHQVIDGNGYNGYPAYAQQAPDGHIAGSSSTNYDGSTVSHGFAVPPVLHPGLNPYNGFQTAQDPNPSVSVHSVGLYNPQPTGIRHTEAYKNQLQDVARIAREIWNGTSGIKDMPGSIRVYVILYHIVQRSRLKYPDDPTLAMLIDGLSNNKDMRPVRNVNGLVCRACTLEKANENLNPYAMSSRGVGIPEKKSFSLPQLFNHFQTTHNGITQAVTWDGEGSPPEWDWTKDMIELPDKAKISSLADVSGADSHKIKLIKEALADAFRPSPAPAKQSPVQEPQRHFIDGPPNQSQLAPSRDHHDKFYSLTYEISTNEPEIEEDYQEYSSNAREVPDRNDSAGASSERRGFEDLSAAHLSRVPITYVEHGATTPATRTRQPSEYWQQEIAEESQFYSDNADPYFSSADVQYRRRITRSPNVPSPDDRSRIERRYGYDMSLPRATQSTVRPNFTDSVYRGANSSVDHYDDDTAYRHEPVRVTSRQVGFQHPPPSENMDDGSEDGEVKAQPSPRNLSRPLSVDAHRAADRFFDDFERSQHLGTYVTTDEETRRRNEYTLNGNWKTDREDDSRRIYMSSGQHHDGRQPVIDQGYNVSDDPRQASYERPIPVSNVRIIPEQSQSQRHVIAYDYNDRPPPQFREPHHGQIYSPEVVDRQYDNNTMHGDDRSEVQIIHQQPTRFARYENVRLEHDNRSRSPIYVSIASQPAQYRERSPGAHYVQQQPTYRTLSPQAVDEGAYERVPRPEYYRVYADESRPRQPQYESQVEYVKMRDAQGEYVIRRSVRREEPAYTTIAEEPLPRQAVYETRAPISRSDPAYYEEYDPRNPAPPPQTTMRQVRYH